IAVGHVCCALLVADEDVVDGELAQRVIHGQDCAAWIAEDGRHSLACQCGPYDLCAGKARRRGEVTLCGLCFCGASHGVLLVSYQLSAISYQLSDLCFVRACDSTSDDYHVYCPELQLIPGP